MYRNNHWLYKVLADPDATESHWLRAAQLLHEKTIESKASNPGAFCAMLTGGFVAIALALSSCLFVRIGYDWGYDAIEAAFGQEHAADQGMIASFSLPSIIFPLLFGIYLAFAKRHFGGERRWLGLLFAVIAGEAIFFNVQFPDGHHPLVACATFLAVAEVAGICAFTLGHKLSRATAVFWRWNGGPIPKRLLVANLIYVLPAGLYGVLGLSDAVSLYLPYAVEVSAYAGLLGLVGMWCGWSMRSPRVSMTRAYLVVSPILVANALNVLANMASLFLDRMGIGADLGWRALASALLIALVSATAPFWGLTIAWYLRRKRTGASCVVAR